MANIYPSPGVGYNRPPTSGNREAQKMPSGSVHFFKNRLSPERSLTLKERYAAIAADPTLPPQDRRVALEASGRAVSVVEASTSSLKAGEFLMSYVHENALVVEWLMLHSSRPKVAGRLWSILLAHMSSEPSHNGEVLITREGMLSRLARPDGPPVTMRSVEVVIAELLSIGAITKTREAVPGIRGRGAVRLFISERVATRKSDTKSSSARSAAYKAAPPLRLKLIGGTDQASERRSRAPSLSLPVPL